MKNTVVTLQKQKDEARQNYNGDGLRLHDRKDHG